MAVGSDPVPTLRGSDIGTLEVEGAEADSASSRYASTHFQEAPGAEPAAVEPGRVVAKRYRLVERLGAGAHGEVWAADDLVLREPVALKWMSYAAGSIQARVRQEITTLRMLRMAGVVRLLDDGVEDGRPFLVMDRVHGAPFPGGAALRDGARPRWTWAELAGPTAALLEVLARVHAAGVVHRDLKPDNILVSAEGQPTLAGFRDLALAGHALAWPGQPPHRGRPDPGHAVLPRARADRRRSRGRADRSLCRRGDALRIAHRGRTSRGAEPGAPAPGADDHHAAAGARARRGRARVRGRRRRPPAGAADGAPIPVGRRGARRAPGGAGARGVRARAAEARGPPRDRIGARRHCIGAIHRRGGAARLGADALPARRRGVARAGGAQRGPRPACARAAREPVADRRGAGRGRPAAAHGDHRAGRGRAPDQARRRGDPDRRRRGAARSVVLGDAGSLPRRARRVRAGAARGGARGRGAGYRLARAARRGRAQALVRRAGSALPFTRGRGARAVGADRRAARADRGRGDVMDAPRAGSPGRRAARARSRRAGQAARGPPVHGAGPAGRGRVGG